MSPRTLTLTLFGFSLLCSLGCPANPNLQPARPKLGSDFPRALRGRYLEADLSQDPDQTRHEIKKTSWTQSERSNQAPILLKVQERLSVNPRMTAVLLGHSQAGSDETFRIRVDFFREDATLWACRHPELSAQDPLLSATADPADRQGRGCFGRPWRKLVRQSPSP